MERSAIRNGRSQIEKQDTFSRIRSPVGSLLYKMLKIRLDFEPGLNSRENSF